MTPWGKKNQSINQNWQVKINAVGEGIKQVSLRGEWGGISFQFI